MIEMINHSLDPRAWAELHFGSAPLSDVRRIERLTAIAEAMASNPGASIPQLFSRPYDIKAAYTFFNHPESAPDISQEAHRDWTLEKMDAASTFLLLEDTTMLDWTGRASIPGLGPIGNRNDVTQGILLHSVLAVHWPESGTIDPRRRPAVEVIGLCDQQYHRRIPRPPGEAKHDSGARKRRERESQLWTNASERIGRAPSHARWVRVGDAEADIYEHLIGCQQQGHGYVIRSSGRDRVLVEDDGRQPVGYLYQTLREAPVLGALTIELYARPGQKAREATLHVSALPVRLRAPQRPGSGKGTLAPVSCRAVRVWEPDPPNDAEALEWFLLCDAPVASFEQARECVLHYSTRWLIEDFHKALKTGLGAEKLQFETAGRLAAAIGIMSVVAVRLVGLREQMRVSPDAPARQSGLDAMSLQILRTTTEKPIDTVRDVALNLARLGGHLNRRRDGLPGWQSLWEGMRKITWLVEGARLSRKLPGFG